MQKSILYLMGTTGATLLLFLMIGLYPHLSHEETAQRLLAEKSTVQRFLLTDICLFTEAPHTRHPNMSDRFVPFQNHPSASAHFPSESFIRPPHHLVYPREVSSEGKIP